MTVASGSGGLPTVIVGAGLSGAGTAWALARRGVRVVVLEQFAAGHDHGGSHGSARIVRRAYGDPLYVEATAAAFDLWTQVEAESGTALLRMLGGLDFGAARSVPQLAGLLAAAGADHEVLSAAAAGERWPGMRFDGEVVFHRQAGVLDADAAVRALLDLAARAGATVRHGTAVTAIGDSGVQLADGSWLPARCVVVAAGGWAGALLGSLPGVPPLAVTRQSVFHFPRLDASTPPWPSTIHEQGAAAGYQAVYHLAGGRDGGPADDRKIGVHDPGPLVEAGAPGAVDAGLRAYLVDYVRRWLPGLVPEPRAETTCLYTSTPTEDFVLDRVGDVVVCSPCSGHGAKFAPLIGEWVASLVTGDGAPVPGRFRLDAHRGAAHPKVSL